MILPGSCQNPESNRDLRPDEHIRASTAFGADSENVSGDQHTSTRTENCSVWRRQRAGTRTNGVRKRNPCCIRANATPSLSIPARKNVRISGFHMTAASIIDTNTSSPDQAPLHRQWASHRAPIQRTDEGRVAEYYVNVEKRQSSRSSVRFLVFVSARARSKCSAGARMPEFPLPKKEGNAFYVGSSCIADTYKLIGPRHTFEYQDQQDAFQNVERKTLRHRWRDRRGETRWRRNK